MCDLLVMRADNGPKGLHWKAGQVVDIYPDGQLGPGTQQHPRFCVIRLPGVRRADVAWLLTPQLGSDLFFGIQIGKREHCIDVAKLTTAMATALDTTRDLTLDVSAAELAGVVTRRWPSAA